MVVIIFGCRVALKVKRGKVENAKKLAVLKAPLFPFCQKGPRFIFVYLSPYFEGGGKKPKENFSRKKRADRSWCK